MTGIPSHGAPTLHDDQPCLRQLSNWCGCAASLLPESPAGVWLVDLAPLTDPALVPVTVARALGLLDAPGSSTSPQPGLAAVSLGLVMRLVDRLSLLSSDDLGRV